MNLTNNSTFNRPHQTYTKNDLGVDCIDKWDIGGKEAELWIVKGKLQVRHRGTIHNIDVPSVTPIRPKGHWIVNKEKDTICCSCCNDKQKIGRDEVELLDTSFTGFRFCKYCGSDNREVVEE